MLRLIILDAASPLYIATMRVPALVGKGHHRYSWCDVEGSAIGCLSGRLRVVLGYTPNTHASLTDNPDTTPLFFFFSSHLILPFQTSLVSKMLCFPPNYF